MINLITGLPGNGKTLYALAYVKAWSEKDSRPVFYSGIADLKLPWTEIEAEKWFDCPPNSIIVIDECQRVFRPRSFGSQVPEYVSKLETHRHQGLDIVLITQHPMLCDPSIRRLAGKHLHVIRKFGMAAATVHEWGSVKESCDKSSGRTDSVKHHWKYPKSAYEYYKSAEAHTGKRNIPFRLYVLFIFIPLLLAFLGYRFYSSVQDKMKPTVLPGREAAQTVPTGVQGGAKEAYLDPVSDAKKFVFNATPRVAGLQYTAPKYDGITKPITAPVPAACVKHARGCDCYSQQGTRLNTTPDQCGAIVEHGYFAEFNPDGARPEAVPVSSSENPASSPNSTL